MNGNGVEKDHEKAANITAWLSIRDAHTHWTINMKFRMIIASLPEQTYSANKIIEHRQYTLPYENNLT